MRQGPGIAARAFFVRVERWILSDDTRVVARGLQLDRDELRSWRVATVTDALQRYQRIHFRVIGCRLTGGYIESEQGETFDPAFAAIAP
ncbi:hypothetical protein D3C72_2123070 [compost metagenome]